MQTEEILQNIIIYWKLSVQEFCFPYHEFDLKVHVHLRYSNMRCKVLDPDLWYEWDFFFWMVVPLMPPELLQSLSRELLYGGDKIKVLWEQEVSFGIHQFVRLSDCYFSHSGYVSNLYNRKMTGVVNLNVQWEFCHIIIHVIPICQLNYWIF